MHFVPMRNASVRTDDLHQHIATVYSDLTLVCNNLVSEGYASVVLDCFVSNCSTVDVDVDVDDELRLVAVRGTVDSNIIADDTQQQAHFVVCWISISHCVDIMVGIGCKLL